MGLVMIFGCGVLACADIPKIPKSELSAIQKLVTQHKAEPANDKVAFDLAIKFASLGFIEEGWAVLKKVSPNYAVEVVKTYESLQKSTPNKWEYPFKLGFAYYFLDEDKKDFTRSLTAFNRVLEIKPDHVWTMGFIALLEGMSGRQKIAIKWCEKALAIEPNAMAIHALLALGYQKEGKLLKAVSHGLIVGRLKSEYALSGYEFDL